MKRKYTEEKYQKIVFQPETLEEHELIEYFDMLLETMPTSSLCRLINSEIRAWQAIVIAQKIIGNVTEYIEKENLYVDGKE